MAKLRPPQPPQPPVPPAVDRPFEQDSTNPSVIKEGLQIVDLQGFLKIEFDSTGSISIFDAHKNTILKFTALRNTLSFGGHGQDGDLTIFNKHKKNIDNHHEATFFLNSDNGTFQVGGGNIGGNIIVKNAADDEIKSQVILINANEKVIQIKGNENNTVDLSGEGILKLGNKEKSGRIELFPEGVRSNENPNNASITLIAKDGLVNCKKLETGRLDTERIVGNVKLDKISCESITADEINTNKINGNLKFDEINCEKLSAKEIKTDRIRGKITLDDIHCRGDITLLNADCAEDFEIENGYDLTPGSVVVLSENGKLMPCQSSYDKKVAGIIAGAGNTKPGIILGRETRSKNKLPVALIGKVYCNVDATETSIEVGDLLTTSSVMGFAMKAIDPQISFGAIIGKALSPLKGARGLIPVLVSLQ